MNFSLSYLLVLTLDTFNPFFGHSSLMVKRVHHHCVVVSRSFLCSTKKRRKMSAKQLVSQLFTPDNTHVCVRVVVLLLTKLQRTFTVSSVDETLTRLNDGFLEESMCVETSFSNNGIIFGKQNWHLVSAKIHFGKTGLRGNFQDTKIEVRIRCTFAHLAKLDG